MNDPAPDPNDIQPFLYELGGGGAVKVQLMFDRGAVRRLQDMLRTSITDEDRGRKLAEFLGQCVQIQVGALVQNRPVEKVPGPRVVK